jgi:hypothetical protein
MILPLLILAQLPRMPRQPPRPTAAPPPLPTALSLVVQTPSGEQRLNLKSKQGVPGSRPAATLKAGEKPQIRWLVSNQDPKNAVRNLVVHFLVTREADTNEAIPATPRKGSQMDQVLGTDLSVKGSTSGNYNTAIHEPGIYLVEVELLDPEGNRRQYAAIDLKVE